MIRWRDAGVFVFGVLGFFMYLFLHSAANDIVYSSSLLLILCTLCIMLGSFISALPLVY